ncbi:MAC/perforin domain-containing protein [Petrimonas sp.]|uniref:MAC/perforin domain-containing protein n=1 Tax=Petrimonas sp. TaxID=2023866 RepID=UPI0030CC1357
MDTDVSLLDMWASEVSFQVQSNGEWTIETQGDWFYVFPTSGSGNATVQICVLENDTQERQTGKVTLLSTTDRSAVQTFEIGQKCAEDYGVTSDANSIPSIKKYAVGYGYNTLNEYASPNSVTKQIVRWNEMKAEDLIQFNAPSARFYERTVVGSSLEQLAQNLSAAVNFGGKYCGFKGEVGATFTSGVTNNEFNEYAISYIEYKVTDISIVTDIEDIRENWMTDAAKKAIDGVSETYRGTEGVKLLFREYGTHLITKADLGGRLRYNLTVDVSKVTGYYDITAYLKASYSNAFVNSDASVDEEMKSSYAQNKSQTTLSFTAIGGDSGPLTDSSDKNAIETWKKSVADYENVLTNKTALIGFGSDLEGLIPLYELATSPARREEIKSVMEGNGFVTVEYEDKNNYQIELPTFTEGVSETLVKDVKDNSNRVIATVCNEFIPEINPLKRVNVIYPVASGKILMHAGFFPGYEGRRPARISWNGSNLKVVDYEELEEREYTNLYLGGVTIRTQLNDEQTAKQTTIHNAYLHAVHFNEAHHAYPLVKIFGGIWTREDYKSNKYGNGNAVNYVENLQFDQSKRAVIDFMVQACNYGTNFLYKRSVVKDTGFAPSGWEVPSSTHYKEIQAMLTKYNLNSGLSFRSNPNSPGHSPLGYEAPTSEKDGWLQIALFYGHRVLEIEYHGFGKENKYWTNDGYHVRMNDSGFAVEAVEDNSGYNDPIYFMSVRLIKKN